MSSLSNLETHTSSQTFSNESITENKKINKKINKIQKRLLNLEKEELSSFIPLKVKVYKEEKEEEKEENKIKTPTTFKNYFEDFRKKRESINQTEPGFINPSNAQPVKVEQIESSDLVDSE